MSGVFLAVAGAVAFSLGHVAVRKAVGTLGVALGTAIMLVVGFIVVTIAALVFDGPSVLLSASIVSILYFAAAGLIHFLAGWGLMNASTKYVGAARMSAITGTTPFFAALLAIVFLQESINLFIAIGIALIIVGSYFITTG